MPHLILSLFAVGLAAVNVSQVEPAPVWACAVGCLGAAGIASRRGAPRRAVLALGCGAMLVGVAWGSARWRATEVGQVSRPIAVAGQVIIESSPNRERRGVVARGRLRHITVPHSLAHVDLRVIVELPASAERVRPGQVLGVVGQLRPSASADAPRWWRGYIERQGISARLRVRRVDLLGRRGGAAGARDWLANTLRASAARGLDGEVAAVVRGMALGGGGGLSEATAERMRDAGLWHLLAVSGQNIGFVAMSVLLALGAVGVRRRVSVAAALGSIILYCLACEGGASVARAGIVGALVLASQLFARARDRWYLTLLGLSVLLAIQPRAIGDPGLQLSFGAVVGLMALAPSLDSWMRGLLPERLAPFAAQSLAVSLTTAPIVIAQFGVISLIGIILNIVAVPLAGPVVVAALLGAGLGAVVPVLAVVPTMLAGLGAHVILALATLAAVIPGATMAAGRWQAIGAGAATAAVAWGAWWLWHAQPWPASRPQGIRRRNRLVAMAAVGAGVIMMLPDAGPPWPGSSTVTMLDIGQGDAILLRSPDGAAALIDTGVDGSPARVVGHLKHLGVRRLDLLALTHDQADHAGAAGAVLSSFDVATVAAPAALAVAPILARRLRRDVVALQSGDVLRLGTWQLSVLWPPPQLRADDPNDAALVMLARSDHLRVLLTADAEGGVLRRLPLGRVDVLKVAHHGSSDGALAPVLAVTRPTLAMISVGAGNRFGHPTPATLGALRASRIPVWRTDLHGTVSVEGQPAGPVVRTGG